MLKDLSAMSKALFKRETTQTYIHGPPLREAGTNVYLQEEIRAAREAAILLDEAVSKAQSFREKATVLLEESHRALSRLEQAMAYREGPELIVVACEIKCAAKRGLTLVNVYGSYGTIVKVMTLMLRSLIYAKYDKVIDHLKSLLPPSEIQGQRDSSNKGQQSQLTTSVSTHDLLGRNPSAYQGLAKCSLNSLLPQTTSITPSGPPQGLLLRPNKHDRVHAMAYVPYTVNVSEYVCIWWSAAQALEFYSESSQSTTSFSIDKPAHTVTCIAIDENGNVWTGHFKGLIRVRRKASWEFMVEDKCFSVPIRCIFFDSFGRVWIGDDSGRIKVLRFVEATGTIEVVASLQRSPRVVSKKSTCSSDSSKSLFGRLASAGALTTALGEGSVRQGQAVIEGPVRAIRVLGNRAWISGGKYSGSISIWNATTYEEEDSFDCSGFGPCHAFSELPWTDNGKHACPEYNTSAGSTVSSSTVQSLSTWRLLSGHENGQLLLWNPDHPVLTPLIRIGDTGSACRGVVVFSNYNIMATAHLNGELHIFAQLNTGNAVPPCSETVTPQIFGTFRPRKAVVRVHKSSVDRMVGYSNSCVTCSQLGTIRLWHASELLQEAYRQGLLSGPTSRAMESLSVLSRSSGQYVSHTRHASRDSVDFTQQSYLDGSHPENTNSVSPPAPAPALFQTIESQELILQKQIGAGAYGKVWLAEWTGVAVAVKELLGLGQGLQSDTNSKEYQALMNEVHLLGGLSHPNIMRFMAFCAAPPLIVMQYYPHGSLFQLLQRALGGQAKALKDLAWNKRLEMLKDVAAGMQYLHSRKPSVIHGDLRSPNLLLDLTIDHNQPRFHLKIADFGLARMLGVQGTSIAVSKTTNPRWTAPEVIKNSTLGKAADVYSFSIIMWEMLTWQQPYQDMMSVQVMFSTVTEDNRPDIPPMDKLPGSPGASLPLYLELMKNCWQANPAGRPDFKEVVETFQVMMGHERKSQVRTSRSIPLTPEAGATPVLAGATTSNSNAANAALPVGGTGASPRSSAVGMGGSPLGLPKGTAGAPQGGTGTGPADLGPFAPGNASVAEQSAREAGRMVGPGPPGAASGLSMMGISMSPILEERHSQILGSCDVEGSGGNWDLGPLHVNRSGSYTHGSHLKNKAVLRVRRTKTDDGAEYSNVPPGQPAQGRGDLGSGMVTFHQTVSPFSAATIEGAFSGSIRVENDPLGTRNSVDRSSQSSAGAEHRAFLLDSSGAPREEGYGQKPEGQLSLHGYPPKRPSFQGKEGNHHTKQRTFSPFAAASVQTILPSGGVVGINRGVSVSPQVPHQQRQYSTGSTSSGGSRKSCVVRSDEEAGEEGSQVDASTYSWRTSPKLKPALKDTSDYQRQRSAPGSSASLAKRQDGLKTITLTGSGSVPTASPVYLSPSYERPGVLFPSTSWGNHGIHRGYGEEPEVKPRVKASLTDGKPASANGIVPEVAASVPASFVTRKTNSPFAAPDAQNTEPSAFGSYLDDRTPLRASVGEPYEAWEEYSEEGESCSSGFEDYADLQMDPYEVENPRSQALSPGSSVDSSGQAQQHGSRRRSSQLASAGLNVSWAEADEKEAARHSVPEPSHGGLHHSSTGTFVTKKTNFSVASVVGPPREAFRYSPNSHDAGSTPVSETAGPNRAAHKRHVSSPSVHFKFDEMYDVPRNLAYERKPLEHSQAQALLAAPSPARDREENPQFKEGPIVSTFTAPTSVALSRPVATGSASLSRSLTQTFLGTKATQGRQQAVERPTVQSPVRSGMSSSRPTLPSNVGRGTGVAASGSGSGKGAPSQFGVVAGGKSSTLGSPTTSLHHPRSSPSPGVLPNTAIGNGNYKYGVNSSPGERNGGGSGNAVSRVASPVAPGLPPCARATPGGHGAGGPPAGQFRSVSCTGPSSNATSPIGGTSSSEGVRPYVRHSASAVEKSQESRNAPATSSGDHGCGATSSFNPKSFNHSHSASLNSGSGQAVAGPSHNQQPARQINSIGSSSSTSRDRDSGTSGVPHFASSTVSSRAAAAAATSRVSSARTSGHAPLTHAAGSNNSMSFAAASNSSSSQTRASASYVGLSTVHLPTASGGGHLHRNSISHTSISSTGGQVISRRTREGPAPRSTFQHTNSCSDLVSYPAKAPSGSRSLHQDSAPASSSLSKNSAPPSVSRGPFPYPTEPKDLAAGDGLGSLPETQTNRRSSNPQLQTPQQSLRAKRSQGTSDNGDGRTDGQSPFTRGEDSGLAVSSLADSTSTLTLTSGLHFNRHQPPPLSKGGAGYTVYHAFTVGHEVQPLPPMPTSLRIHTPSHTGTQSHSHHSSSQSQSQLQGVSSVGDSLFDPELVRMEFLAGGAGALAEGFCTPVGAAQPSHALVEKYPPEDGNTGSMSSRSSECTAWSSNGGGGTAVDMSSCADAHSSSAASHPGSNGGQYKGQELLGGTAEARGSGVAVSHRPIGGVSGLPEQAVISPAAFDSATKARYEVVGRDDQNNSQTNNSQFFMSSSVPCFTNPSRFSPFSASTLQVADGE